MKGKVVFVTGAASGIGKACVERFVAQGAAVVLADREDTSAMAESIESKGGQALAVRVDVSDEQSVAALFTATETRFSRLDVLAHAAGISRRGMAPDVSLDDWNAVVDINFKGTFLCCRGAVALMRNCGGGAIVTIGSELAYVAASNISVYSASKAGVVHLTRCLARDHGVDDIRINCVCPGPIETPMLKSSFAQSRDPDSARRGAQASTIMGRFGRPEEIANVVHFLASHEASFMTGSIVLVDGGVTSKSP